MKKPNIPEVIEKFVLYLRKNSAWGSLHIVLDDENLDDKSVQFCIEWAEERSDHDGVELGKILLSMSKTQRGEISRVAREREFDD